MTKNTGIGAAVRRKEDRAFLTGDATFTDDYNLPNQAYAAFVRADIPHGRIVEIETGEVSDDVLVLTYADIAARLNGPIPSFNDTPPFDIRDQDGRTAHDASQYPLARDKVRYLGEPVAVVVASTLAAARDGAEQVYVTYDPLMPITQYDQARDENADLIWEEAGSNISIDKRSGDIATVAAAMQAAEVIASTEVVNNRIVVNFMEPRSAIADYDTTTDHLTLTAGCQGVHGLQGSLKLVLKLAETTVQVVAPATGGGFGARNGLYPEFAVLAIAAMQLARPVKWTATRSEAILSDNQARDHVLRGELAIDDAGRFTALKVDADWRHGAYFTSRNLFVMLHYFVPVLVGAYRIPAIDVRMRGLFSNTTPQSAFRGVGRMEANYLMESLVDQAALATGINRVEIRRRNLISPAEMPWSSPTGATYTSGEFGRVLNHAMELIDWQGFTERQVKTENNGLKRGIGLGMYVENDGSTPTEFAEVEATADGKVNVFVGTQDFGMGHATIYSQILSQELGIPFEDIEVVYGDTAKVKRGSGTHGSRSARMGGTATLLGSRAMVENGKTQASDLLEASVEDIEFSAGSYHVVGTDRSVTLAAVAQAMADNDDRLSGDADFEVEAEVHANGCQICEVTVDPETGQVVIENYVAAADVGTAINPMIVEGQLHGGATQGIGQAVFEGVMYDRDSGQTLTGSFMDYAMPRASDLPNFTLALDPVVEQDNPLGVKGVGESSATGAPAAVMNAIRHAVGAHVDMPATPENVWRALNKV